jgi:nucleoid-associated protein YgaU
MRKDVRFGLTIAGSLLLILIIWAALYNRGTSDKSAPIALQPATQPTDVTTAEQLTNTATPSQSTDLTANTPAATQPADAGSHDWTTLLATGGSTPLAAGGSTTQPASGAMPAAWSTIPIGASPLPTAGATTRPTVAAGTHKVLSGETFFTIARAVYGDSKYFTRLEDANPTVNPNRLRVGTIINVPGLDVPLPVKAAYTVSSTGGAPATVDTSKSYRVRSSDTLMGIARRLYGNGQMWQKIYNANRDMIGPNPARLTVGMVLRLPEPPTMAGTTPAAASAN